MTVHLISGDDASLVLSALTELVHRLVGDGDRSLMVDEFDHPDDEMRAIVDAAQTPPFLTDHRVVIVRDVGRFTSDDVAPLVAYLTDPLPTTHLVVVAGAGKTAKSLADALKACGAQVHDTTPPSKAKDRVRLAPTIVKPAVRVSSAATRSCAK